MDDITPIVLLLLFVTGFGLFLVFLAAILGPKIKSSSIKSSSYECGLKVQSTGHSKVPVKFYLTAILFILFDIEIIFMYPWAIAYSDFISEGFGLYTLLAMGFFLLVFMFGLFWEIKSKALEWD